MAFKVMFGHADNASTTNSGAYSSANERIPINNKIIAGTTAHMIVIKSLDNALISN